MNGSARRLLEIYLRDHRAGAVAGRRLARRVKAENAAPEWAPIGTIARQVEEDETTLEGVMDLLGAREGAFKKVVAVVVEMSGRLTPNGRALGYSPLSRVLELESLMSGIQAKRLLWIALRQIAQEDPNRTPGVDFEGLEARAFAQLETLYPLHIRAVRVAFIDGEMGRHEAKSNSPYA